MGVRSRRRQLISMVSALALALGAAPASPASATPADVTTAAPGGTTHTITYDRYSLMIDGERVWLWSAEFHYYRLPNPDLWRDQLEKLKATGFNAISVYFSWAYHSPATGVYDFTGVRDIERLLDTAEEVGLYVLARPGPYLNAELDSGGYPAWLTTQAGRARSRADDYQAAWEEWFDHVNPIIARHQVTDGGDSVLLFQIENEYDGSDAVYMEELKAAARADGITVPLFHNDKGRNLRWASGPGAPDLYATDTYPAGFDCNRTSFPGLTDYRFLRGGVGDRPFIWGEFQGGAFDPWGGPGYDRCRQMTGPTFERMFYANNIENQFTVHNIYMTYGGTNWGWQADPNVVYTSYDYGAAFNEQRELTEKVPVLKQQAYLVQSVADLAKTDDLGQQSWTNPAIRVWVKENPDTHAKFYFVRHAGNGTAATNDSTAFTVDVSDGTYAVPQQPGTALQVNGRDFKILPAGYDLEHQRLVYSTSEIMTHAHLGDRDVALLHGRAGEPGETVLRYPTQPRVDVLAGDVAATWDAESGDLRLNYAHNGLSRVRLTAGGRPALDLLLADSDTAATFWRLDTNGGPVLARGPYLVRSAERHGATLVLRGDTDRAGDLEVFAGAEVKEAFWNDKLIEDVAVTPYGSLLGTLDGPEPVELPQLTDWRYLRDVPEADPAFDDGGWVVADKTTTTNPTKPGTLPVLYTDEYGFHHGDVWYRGRFRASGSETGISLTAGTGRAGAWAVWVNGVYLDTVATGTASGNQSSSRDLTFPDGLIRPGEDNVVSVLVRNMGHNENGGSNDGHKAPRGLLSARLTGPGTALSWRIQGVRGGESLFDTVRGPLNNGGLHGERAGYPLPGYPDRDWATVTLPHRDANPGVVWYRTRVRLDLPGDHDVPVGLRFTDDPARRYRVLIFVNGWNVGQYVNNVGPQRVFTLPQGILRHHGDNTIALAVWSYDGAAGGLGQVSLEALGDYATSIRVRDLGSPRYDPHRYAEPDGVTLRLDGPSLAGEDETFTVTAALSVPTGPGLSDVSFGLTAPDGWAVAALAPTRLDMVGSGTARVSWRVTSPAGVRAGPVPLRATVAYTRSGAAHELSDARFIGYPPPPPPPGQRWVSDLPFVSATNGWGPVERDMSNGEQSAGDGGTITIDGAGYPKGIGAHAVSEIVLALGGECHVFHAVVGVDDSQGGNGSVVFSVVGDGVPLATTPVLRGSSPAYSLEVDITAVNELRLRVGDGGDGNGRDHADWGGARLSCAT